ncbi:cytochrome P450 [Pseudonocardia xishanensis]|uniref:FAD-binding FR-type domain-containing protein n=1 Tax=Pseudonocardia xishanensis TaxID=630995 RepID=A0ABP8RXK9_9PSEU
MTIDRLDAPPTTREATATARVVGKTVVADCVVELRLVAADDEHPLGPWSPGAHIDLGLPNGLVRQYSLLPAEPGTWWVAVLREVAGRGGSAFCHDALHVGEAVRVTGPRNHFVLDAGDRYLFVAGGIGIAPLIGMIDAAEAAGAEWELVYAGRTAGSMAFATDLARRNPDRVRLHVDAEHGLLDVPGLLRAIPADTQIYACGPTGLLDVLTAHAQPGSLRVERFSPMAVDDTDDLSFEVELTRSGVVVDVPVGVSVLDAVGRAGVQTLSSCGEGTCGTCETPVLAGEVDHRDAILTDGTPSPPTRPSTPTPAGPVRLRGGAALRERGATELSHPSRDTEIGGIPIREGQKVMLLVGSANRDRERWGPTVDTFDIDRQSGSGHLTFGRGIHQCIGRPIARMEAESLLGALARKVSVIELVGEPVQMLNNTLRGFRSIPLRLKAV